MAQEQANEFCKEGDRQLANGNLSWAAAFYTAAFGCCSSTAIQKVVSHGEGFQTKMFALMEKWCQAEEPIPKIQYGNLGCRSLDVGIVATFLLALNPYNVVASVFRIEALLKLGHYQEAADQCQSLLHLQPCTELLLTHALALLLSQRHVHEGLTEYLQAFVGHQDETVAFVRCNQKKYLSRIIQSSLDCLSLQENSDKELIGQKDLCYEFLAAIAPEDIQVCQAQATYFLEKRRYKECVTVYSRALEVFSSSGSSGHHKAQILLLLGRALAFFSLGGHTPELRRDLTAAFEMSPNLAKNRFEDLFSPGDSKRIEMVIRGTLGAEFAAYKEAVRMRPEVRSDSGKELLAPLTQTLYFLVQISPDAKRELSVQLADCYLLQGNITGSLEMCLHLLESTEMTYRNTLLTLRGFSHLHANRCPEALQDFQTVLEDSSPHPSSCVKALCGRGLIRAWGQTPYLTAMDYLTACRLRWKETSFVIKAYVPWNQRGFLMLVLQEQAQKMLERNEKLSNSVSQPDKARRANGFQKRERSDALGTHQLASLLMELDGSDETSQVLCADALYQMDRLDEARKLLLVTLSKSSKKSPVLARLALLQLKKGFLYDCNQLLKKMIQTDEGSGLQEFVKILKEQDRVLLKTHCHTRALTTLKNKCGATYLKEAIGYLSLAIAASGGFAIDSLLVRARCYGFLGHQKTAIFDFKTILKEDPNNSRAFCGKGLIHLALNQKKESVQDLISALCSDSASALAEIHSVKLEAQALIRSWLLDHCSAVLLDSVTSQEPLTAEHLEDLTVVGASLLKMESKDNKAHILWVDLLTASGKPKEALSHLQRTFGQSDPEDAVNARLGILQVKMRNLNVAVHILAALAAKDYQELGSLMGYLDTQQRLSLAKVATKEANTLAKEPCHAKALGYHTLAIFASNSNPRYLRQHATCCAQLKDYRKALGDIHKVVQNHGANSLKTQVGDFCSWGDLLWSMSEEELAVKQYVRALQLEKSLALGILTSLNREELARAFLRTAQSYLAADRYEEAWSTAKFGLDIDRDNYELKKLKARIKCFQSLST